MKKTIFILSVFCATMFFGVVNVDAKTVKTTLAVPNTQEYYGSARDYNSGQQHISIDIDDWYDACTNGYSYLTVGLMKPGGPVLATKVSRVKLYMCYDYIMGNFSAGEMIYYFSTKYNGNYYCGVRSNNVLLYNVR